MGREGSAGTVLGLFPALDVVGGVQTSGQVAWETIVERSAFATQKSHLLTYGGARQSGDGYVSGLVRRCASRLRAVVAALTLREPAGLVIVWHLDLLKLLPFCQIRGAKVVLFLLGIEAWRRQGRATRQLLRKVTLFLSISDYTWRRFVEANPECVHTSHLTVYLGLNASVSDEPASPRTPPTALMVSRLLRGEDYKGHREMIGAWPLLLRRLPGAELWIAGEGDLRPDLEALVARLGLAKRVRFFGSVSDRQKEDLLAQCRCLAMPSSGEGFGLVYLEAMRMGRPCLVSTLDAGREVVNPPEAGLAVDPGNAEQLAEALSRLLSEGPEWAAWSRGARRRYEAHFTAGHFRERLLAALGPLDA